MLIFRVDIFTPNAFLFWFLSSNLKSVLENVERAFSSLITDLRDALLLVTGTEPASLAPDGPGGEKVVKSRCQSTGGVYVQTGQISLARLEKQPRVMLVRGCQEWGSWLVRHVCPFSSCRRYWICLAAGQCLWGDRTGFGSSPWGYRITGSLSCMAYVLAHPMSCSSVHRHGFCSGDLCTLHFQKHTTGQLCAFG